MSNFPTLRAGALAVGDCSDKAPGKKRHNVVLCEPAAEVSGPAAGGNRGGTPPSTFGAALSFSQTPYRTSRYFAASSKPPRPGTWSFERWISDAYHLSRLAARSRATLVRHRLRPRELCRVPPRVPQGGLPPTNLRGGCPATARLAARFNQYDATNPPPTQKHRFALLHGSSVKVRRPGPQKIKSHARR